MVCSPDPRRPTSRPWVPLGARIASARRVQAWPPRQLAQAVGMQTITVQLWETGQHRPRRHLLRRIAAVLDLSLAELVTLAGYAAATDDTPA